MPTPKKAPSDVNKASSGAPTTAQNDTAIAFAKEVKRLTQTFFSNEAPSVRDAARVLVEIELRANEVLIGAPPGRQAT